MKEDEEDHKCSDPRCQAGHMSQREQRKWRIDNLRRNGFYVTFVPDGFATRPHPICHLVNFSTRGFEETWGHPDFQIVMSLPPTTALAIFWNLADRVKAGEKFEAGKRYEGIVTKPYSTLFMDAEENGRKVLRILVPDKNNRFPGEKDVDPAFEIQTQA